MHVLFRAFTFLFQVLKKAKDELLAQQVCKALSQEQWST